MQRTFRGFMVLVWKSPAPISRCGNEFEQRHGANSVAVLVVADLFYSVAGATPTMTVSPMPFTPSGFTCGSCSSTKNARAQMQDPGRVEERLRILLVGGGLLVSVVYDGGDTPLSLCQQAFAPGYMRAFLR